MGKVLEQYYDYAKNKGAFVLRMRLSLKTGWSTARVRSLTDSKVNIKKVRDALIELLGTKDIPNFEE
ncbi:hypothetical protein JXJ21_04995 [candidate division KSB1 bacterium]|nr:hypothetical protein [candidate division KSB1 bacterium]